MKWLKDRLFHYKLKSKLSALPEHSTDVMQNEVQSIGILFDESHIPDEKALQYYIDRWKGLGKKVEKFSYADVKEFPEDSDNESRFCRKDINWYQVPQGAKIDAFLTKTFDILITLNPSKKPYLHYLNAASRASFKIGLLPDELEFYNLILDVQETDNVKKIFGDIQNTLDNLSIK